MTTVSPSVDSTTANGQLDEHVVIVLAVGIPAVAVIISLVTIILIILGLILRKSGTEEEVEAMYIRRRFKGLSLEEQRKLQNRKRNKAKAVTVAVARKGSATADSKASLQRIHAARKGSATTDFKASLQRTHAKNAKIRSANPFGLQEWQLKLSGIEIDVDTEETDIDGDEETGRRTMGAINPLMMQGVEDVADYEPAKQPSKGPSHAHAQAQVRGRIHLAGRRPQESSDSDSSDSFNPYD